MGVEHGKDKKFQNIQGEQRYIWDEKKKKKKVGLFRWKIGRKESGA